MNNDDDFGQYNCLAENIHGRMEAIVFVLSRSLKDNEEEFVLFF